MKNMKNMNIKILNKNFDDYLFTYMNLSFDIYNINNSYQTNLKDKIFFRYIIVGDILFTIDNIIDGLFYNDKIVKLLINAKFYYDISEHDVDTRRYLDLQVPEEFFIHDLNHSKTVQEEMFKNEEYLDDYRKFYLKCRKYIRSFEHRYGCVILFFKFFESKLNNRESIDDYLKNITSYTVEITDIQDAEEYFNALKYVSRAPDFNSFLYDKITMIDGFNYKDIDYEQWEIKFGEVFNLISQQFETLEF